FVTTMKCDETRTWLLASRPGAALPPGVLRHLKGCLRCRRRALAVARLGRTEEALRRTPLPSADLGAPARLGQSLDPLPRLPPAPTPAPPRLRAPSWVAMRILTAGLAAALLVGLGLLTVRMLLPARSPVPAPPGPAAQQPTGEPLASRVLEQDL